MTSASVDMAKDARAPRPSVLFLLAFLPMLVLYASTRARTVTGEDSGELVTAAYQLGVAHPPGYPIWVLLTKGFQTLFSGLNPADAAALGSSFTTAAAIGILALVAFRLTRSVAASLFGAWCVGVGEEIWNHATIAEIYPLTLFLLATCLLLFMRWQEQPTRSRFFWLTLLYGCGLANHPTFHLFLPVFGIAAICVRPRILLDWRTLALGFLGLALPHLAYLETFIAAASGPYLSWGVQPTLRSVFGHYIREIYSIGPPKTTQAGVKVVEQLGFASSYALANLTLPGIIAGLIGLGMVFRRNRVAGGLALTLALLGTVGLVPFINFDLEREDIFTFRVFLMPGYLFFGIGIAAIAERLSRAVPEPIRRPSLCAALLVPVIAAALQYQHRDRTEYYWSDDYGRALLADLPKNAVLLPGGDTSTFPLLYLQGCLHLRRDVVIIDRSGTIERGEALALLPEPARTQLRRASRETLLSAIMTLSGRPVVSLKPERIPPDIDLAFEPFQLGLMGIPTRDRKAKESLGAARVAFFEKLRFRNEDLATLQDYTADVIRSHLAQARAVNLFKLGNPPAALAQTEVAASFAQGIKETLNNLGSMIAENGLPERSERFFREALAIRADYQLARQNLVVILRGREKLEDAFAQAQIGARLDPKDPYFFKQATELAVALSNGRVLSELCDARIRAVPEDPAPHRILGEWALDHDHAPSIARAHFEAALAVDPTDERSRRALKDVRGVDDRPDVAAKAAEQGDPAAEFAALLPPSTSDLRRDFPPSARARRFWPGEAADPIIGAADLRSILGQVRPTGAFSPMGELGLPEPNVPAQHRQSDAALEVDQDRSQER